MLRAPRPPMGHPRRLVLSLYLVGVFALLVGVLPAGGWWATFEAAVACCMFWAGGVTHERYAGDL